ncbi:hypothetical protein HPB52_018588 [Rhipicephalus sanguineus]|uniref:CCHC-type domain-containing protein n=1 Tax=Rhipicephalus sanguineus TaxID=34632 RepID=A0A9D4Q1Q9_RHISA|nr:hypothetical protein HPB52_018588 [Rhipicephalus sanguineus]
MCDYRGVQKVCSKCRNAGHIAKDCSTPRCARCNIFGHATEGCTELCRKCSGSHATADCIRPKSFAAAAAAAADEQEGNDLTPPTPAPQEDFPALETVSDTDTPDTEAHAEPQDAGDLPLPSEKVSSTPRSPVETSDSSPDAYEDHSSSKAEAPVSVPSRHHESCSSDTGGTTSRSEALRTSRGRGTRATGRAEAPIIGPDKTTTVIMPPTATSTRASKYSAQTRKLSLSNPLHKITGSAAGVSDGASAMEIDRQATKRVHPPTTDSEGSTDSSKPQKLANALTTSEHLSL